MNTATPTGPATQRQLDYAAILLSRQVADWRDAARSEVNRTARISQQDAEVVHGLWQAVRVPETLTQAQASMLIEALNGKAYSKDRTLHGVEVLVNSLLTFPATAGKY